MAKAVKKKTNEEDASDKSLSLTLDLFTPGMTAIHRAGLGGLVCSLRAMERDVQSKQYKGDVPGGKWTAKNPPPWTIEETRVTLHIGKPEDAQEWFNSLFAYSYQLREEMIFMPGQHASPPPEFLLPTLQDGILRSFYDHGPQSRGLGDQRSVTENVDGVELTYKYSPVLWYKHRRDGATLATDSLSKKQDISRMLSPGTVVKHAGIGKAKGAFREGWITMIPLLFAPVGCPIHVLGGRMVRSGKRSVFKRGSLILIPRVQSLTEFPAALQALIPNHAKDGRLASASDAVLNAEVQLRAASAIQRTGIDGFETIWCCACDWNSKLQPPLARSSFDSHELRQQDLELYSIARSELPPLVRTKELKESKGRGKKKVVTKRKESFWVDSIVRPLVATNLARGQPWYTNFVDLFIKTDPVSKRPLRTKLSFEKKGLNKMVQTIAWNDTGESTVVNAVHESIRRRYAIIASENKNAVVAMKKRWKGEYDRWRLALAGAKTSEQFRKSLCDLFSRAGVNSELQKNWQALLPMLSDGRWRQTRDLALLGLASYSGKGAKDIEEANEEAGETSDDAA